MRLSDHFTLGEFTASDTATQKHIDNTPPPECVINLTKLALSLEEVRKILGGKPIKITSGYRSLDLNAAVGGVANSDHIRGLAADFQCPDYGTPLEICQAIVYEGIRFGQLILEKPKDIAWVHFSIHPTALPQNRVITIDKHGTRLGLCEV